MCSGIPINGGRAMAPLCPPPPPLSYIHQLSESLLFRAELELRGLNNPPGHIRWFGAQPQAGKYFTIKSMEDATQCCITKSRCGCTHESGCWELFRQKAWGYTQTVYIRGVPTVTSLTYSSFAKHYFKTAYIFISEMTLQSFIMICKLLEFSEVCERAFTDSNTLRFKMTKVININLRF